MGLFNVSSLVRDVSGAVQSMYDSTLQTPRPVFKDATERRTTQAMCTMVMGEDLCVPKREPSLNNFMLSIFKGAARDVMPSADSSGRDVISFNWADKSFNLLCGAGTCSISEYMQPQKSFTVVDVLLGILSAPLACEGPDKFERDAGQFEDVVSPEADYPWVFCKKKRYNDCFENEHIQDKLSTRLYLAGPFGFSGCADNMYTVDYDNFILSLLKHASFCVKLKGDNLWPSGYFEKCILMSRNPYGTPHYQDGISWIVSDHDENVLGGDFQLVVNQDNWTIQLWLQQLPDLCWAVYETPCGN